MYAFGRARANFAVGAFGEFDNEICCAMPYVCEGFEGGECCGSSCVTPDIRIDALVDVVDDAEAVSAQISNMAQALECARAALANGGYDAQAYMHGFTEVLASYVNTCAFRSAQLRSGAEALLEDCV